MKRMCGFCKKFDFSKARTRIDEDGAIIELALCNTKFSTKEQFNFCPVCPGANHSSTGSALKSAPELCNYTNMIYQCDLIELE